MHCKPTAHKEGDNELVKLMQHAPGEAIELARLQHVWLWHPVHADQAHNYAPRTAIPSAHDYWETAFLSLLTHAAIELPSDRVGERRTMNN